MRIAVLFDNLGPYHIARLAALGKSSELLAVELKKTSSEYAWNSTGHVPFERLTLFENDFESVVMAERISQTLEAFQPEVIFIPGWSSKAALHTLLWALRTDIPAILMSASQRIDFRRNTIREFVKRQVLRGFSGAIVGGRGQASYVIQLGMEEDSVRLGYNVVDNAYFANRVAFVHDASAALRQAHSLPERFFLTTARLIEKKNLFTMLKSYAAYRNVVSPKQARDIVILGDGELRDALVEKTLALGLSEHVHYPGFKQYEDLPIFYGLADAFILPSLSEQWGLVVNEAMASGLPVLVSDRCGCAIELVEEGRNGYRFSPTDADSLSALMLQLSQLGDAGLENMAAASRDIVDQWSPETFRANAIELAEMARQSPRRRVSLLTTAIIRALAK
ncbi:MAG: glycosyltransferase family 4 protein [Planctomycetaceae bacterium]|nr:glycosyltransferase family 4 protein [Planctomycetaceae bacterium]